MAAVDYSRVLFALQAKPAGNGYWKARCPAHDDRNPSLSLRIATDDGRLLVKCHAGCSTKAVVEAVGLKMSDLFADEGKPAELPKRRVSAEYVYRDEQGNRLFRVCRTEPKGFFQDRWECERWRTGLGDVRRVLYRLPELVAAPGRLVFVVEGEKDADRLAALGFLATTNPGGAQSEYGTKWLPEYSKALAGRPVAIIPDNDEPGWRHAMFVLGSVLAYGVTSARLVELPDLPPKGDVSGWLDQRHTAADLKGAVRAAPEWRPWREAA